MGIDTLMVDEADLFKNLGYATKMTRIAGLPNTDSNRAFDMYIKASALIAKAQTLASKIGGRIVFATGTPVSNTIAELYMHDALSGARHACRAQDRTLRRLGCEFRRGGHRS